MHEHDHRCCGCLSNRVSRRGFLAAAGASAAALQMGLLESSSTLIAGEPEPKSKPRVRVVFIRPKDQAKYWMSWPGNDYNADERQANFTKLLTKIAKDLGIQLEVDPAALEDEETVDAALDHPGRLCSRRQRQHGTPHRRHHRVLRNLAWQSQQPSRDHQGQSPRLHCIP